MHKVLAILLLAGVLGACTSVPPTNVHQPMTARPQPRPDNLAATGSIFQAGSSRTLFEDRRARYVGDTMTIAISEANNASSKSNTKASRATSTNASVPTVSGLPGKSLQGLSLSATSASSLDGKGEFTVFRNEPLGDEPVLGAARPDSGAQAEQIGKA